jgi:hypothetical protein
MSLRRRHEREYGTRGGGGGIWAEPHLGNAVGIYDLLMATIEIHDADPEMIAFLQERADRESLSLNEYLCRVLDELAAVPTPEELVSR